tara:strand:+ start:304 stop:1233 length:930 start_codon:yes stop_codon:yes gene_type:complete
MDFKKLVDMAIPPGLRDRIGNPDWDVSLEDIFNGLSEAFPHILSEDESFDSNQNIDRPHYKNTKKWSNKENTQFEEWWGGHGWNSKNNETSKLCATYGDENECDDYLFNQINEEGYRSDSFDGEDGIIFIGCSLTFGSCLEKEFCWPWLVGKSFNKKVWNLGQVGNGSDICFLNALKWIPKLKNPTAVCMMIPPSGRFYMNERYPYNVSEFNRYLLRDVKKPKLLFLHDDYNLFLNQLKNVMSINLICNEYKIPFIVSSWRGPANKNNDWEQHIEKFSDDKAFDNLHPGRKWHKMVSKWYIDEVGKILK